MQSRHTQLSAANAFDNILAAGAKSGTVPHEYVDSLGDAADAGSEVLVNGTSGRVGSYVVQPLPAAQQVEVVATDTDADFERLRELGAPKIIDDNAGSVTDQGVVAYYADGVDTLVNLAGNSLEQIPLGEVEEASGVSFTTTGPDEDTLAAVGLTGRKVMAHATREVTTPVATKGAEGSMQVSVAQVLDSTTPPKVS